MPDPILRELATRAIERAATEAWGEPDTAGRAILHRYADAVLAAVLPDHRGAVLREAVVAVEAEPFDLRVSSIPDMGGYWRPDTVTNALAALSNPAPEEGS